MSWVFLILQGGLVGFLAGLAFPDLVWQFWVAITVNSALTVNYGAFKEN